ncbi:odorant receptor 13a-like [Hylaeus anthracinus]|uniref:odorant receptor 13a-like n=1 Tax=Hylaeus anthracinus TaxID=313031 RepID=UPI0023B9CDD9|nr:odorant receptor 13a-like [Hylaeus anthracinus]
MTPLKILAWPVGTWPLQKHSVSSVLRSVISICLLLVMMTIIQTEIYLDHRHAEKNLDGLMMVGCSIMAISKVMWFRLRSEGLTANFSSALKDYDELDGEEKRAIMRRHAYMGRVACASVIGFSYFGSTLYVSVSMLGEDAEAANEDVNVTLEEPVNYPFPSQCTMEMLQVPKRLNPVIFIFEYVMLLITSTGNLGSDSLFFGIMFHLCGQAEVLKLELTKLVKENQDTANRFNSLIARHHHLLTMSDYLNDTIGSILVVQLFTSCILICTTGFAFILSLNVDIVLTIKTLLSASTLLSQLYAYSYVGDYLKTQMEDIGFSIYSSSWYDLPSRLSRDVVFVVMRTQEPTCLRAGNFFVVNMESYMSIVKTSMSYLSVLRVMLAP